MVKSSSDTSGRRVTIEQDGEQQPVEVVTLTEGKSEDFRKFLDSAATKPDMFTKSVPRRGLTPAEKRQATRLEKRYEGQASTGSKQQQDEFLTSYDFFEVVPPPYNMEYLTKLYDFSPAHAACVRVKVANVVGLGYKFHETESMKIDMRKLKGEARRRAFEELASLKSSLWSWTEGTNQEDTFIEVLQKVWTDYEVTGNGYLEIGRKGNNEIGYIGHIPAHTMRVRRERDGFVQINGRKSTYFRRFGQRGEVPVGDDPNPNEIIHFKKYTPSNSYYGLPDIIPAINAIAGNQFAERFNIEYFENKAVPRYIIVTKNASLSPKSERRILEFFQTNLKGQSHRTVIVPLNESVNGRDAEFIIKPVEAGVQEASFVRYFQLNNDEIFMAHRVPKTKVSMGDGTNLAAARDADKTFKEQVIRPEQQVLETKIGPIWSKKTDAVFFKLNEMSLTDEDTRSKIWERRLKTQSATPNEERMDRGEIGLEGGDEVLDIFDNDAATPAERMREELRPSEKDSERSANSPDNDGEARNAKGEGPQRGGR